MVVSAKGTVRVARGGRVVERVVREEQIEGRAVPVQPDLTVALDDRGDPRRVEWRSQLARGRAPPMRSRLGDEHVEIDVDRHAGLPRSTPARARHRSRDGSVSMASWMATILPASVGGLMSTPCGAHRASGHRGRRGIASTTDRTSRRRRPCSSGVRGGGRSLALRSGARSTRSAPAAASRRASVWTLGSRPSVLVGRDHRLGGAGPPGELGLGQPGPHPRRPRRSVRPACREYIGSSISSRPVRAVL